MTPAELQAALRGVVAISITPMTDSLMVDEQAVRSHLQFLTGSGLKAGAATVVVGGSTGECGALTVAERKRLLEVALDEVGGTVPVIAGCNHSSIDSATELAVHAEASGAAGVMLLAPYYYTPTDRVVRDFFQLVSEKISIGIMLYNNIEVTGHDISVSTLTELAHSSAVVGVKECTPDFVKMEQLCRHAGGEMTIVNGHGEFLEPFAAMAGAAGFISSTANFAPQAALAMWQSRSAGNYALAKDIRDALTPYLDLVRRFAADGGEPRVLSVIKAATDVVSRAGPGRLPLQALDESERNQVTEMLAALESAKLTAASTG